MIHRKGMLSILVAGAIAVGGSARAQPPDRQQQIRAQIQQLGSQSFAEREEAERRLVQNDRAVLFIKQACVGDATPEVRRRCARILEKRRANARDEVLRQLEEMIHCGEFNRAAGVAFAWRLDLREKLSDFQKTAAQCLCDSVEKKTKRSFTIPKLPEKLRIEVGGPDEVILRFTALHLLVARSRIKTGVVKLSAFLASEHMESGAVIGSIAFVGGSAEIAGIDDSIVYVNGDLTVGFTGNSLIVCTGNIDAASNGFKNSTVIAAGKIKMPVNLENTILRAQEKELAEILRPWSATELGLEPAVRDGRVSAGRVAPKSPMAQAGVEASDILLSMDGEKIVTQAEAEKLLRQKSAEFMPFVVRVKRGERELELIVPWEVPSAAPAMPEK